MFSFSPDNKRIHGCRTLSSCFLVAEPICLVAEPSLSFIGFCNFNFIEVLCAAGIYCYWLHNPISALSGSATLIWMRSCCCSEIYLLLLVAEPNFSFIGFCNFNLNAVLLLLGNSSVVTGCRTQYICLHLVTINSSSCILGTRSLSALHSVVTEHCKSWLGEAVLVSIVILLYFLLKDASTKLVS